MATRLKTKHSKTIGLIVPEFRSSFFPSIIAGIQKVIDENGYQLLITQSNESFEIEESNLKLLENNMVEGILISITREGENSDLYKKMIDSGIPFVFFNRVCTKIAAPKVIINDYKLAFFATEHLIYNKFNKIVHFAGPDKLSVTRERKRGFIDAMKKHHRVIDSDSVVVTSIYSEKGYDAMKLLIDTKNIPDAIFCFNDPTAIGALKAIKEAGLNCPNDIALVGFSETEIAELVEPPLTTVKQPTFEMGETAARLLLEQINQNPPPPPITICLNGQMNIRKSSIKTSFV